MGRRTQWRRMGTRRGSRTRRRRPTRQPKATALTAESLGRLRKARWRRLWPRPRATTLRWGGRSRTRGSLWRGRSCRRSMFRGMCCTSTPGGASIALRGCHSTSSTSATSSRCRTCSRTTPQTTSGKLCARCVPYDTRRRCLRRGCPSRTHGFARAAKRSSRGRRRCARRRRRRGISTIAELVEGSCAPRARPIGSPCRSSACWSRPESAIGASTRSTKCREMPADADEVEGFPFVVFAKEDAGRGREQGHESRLVYAVCCSTSPRVSEYSSTQNLARPSQPSGVKQPRSGQGAGTSVPTLHSLLMLVLLLGAPSRLG
mmetsp:Transcript_16627/g.63238  ORF Transcript_16627/g.63238 Transcript_16627/m.63238 type:complete len:318 (-) Transcript_16627:621-1574(-)